MRGRRNYDGYDNDYVDDDEDNVMITMRMTMEKRLTATRTTTTMRMPRATTITVKRSLITMRIMTTTAATAKP